jgi:hypothetical protein
MTNHGLRSSYESDNQPWSKRAAHRAVLNLIGQSLMTLYAVPQESPPKMLMILTQLNVPHVEE